jgi:TonB family protein
MRMKLRVALLALLVLAAATARAQDQPGAASDTAKPSPQQSDPTQKPTRIRIGANVTSAKLVHMVSPIYPPIAKTANVSGTVVLHCVIAKDGTMSDVTYVSGPPLLLKSAMDAVRQWTYQPTLLNGEPVEVDTTVSVVFTLGGKPAGDAPQQEAAAAAPKNSESTTVTVPATPIDPQFAADIQRLMDLTHLKENQEEAMRKILEPMRPSLAATFPRTANREKIIDAYMDKLVGLIQSKDLMNRLVSLYAQFLTDEDARAAIAFYETPAGQHYLQSSIKLAPEVMIAGEQVTADKLPSIFKDLCKEFPELQGEAKFCGPEDPTRKSLLLAPNSFPAGN